MSAGGAEVLVTGAGGFVGGHVARLLAAGGRAVRGLTRRPPRVEPGDPPIEWMVGDLLDPATLPPALAGVRAVVHAASWVSLASDPAGLARRVNVEATRALVSACAGAGVGRLVYTSTLHTLAAGTAEAPADEDAPWNLQRVDSPYARTKREAEGIVRDGACGRVDTVTLCPGMVLGPRDPRPTSTRVLLALARSRVVALPGGGIPVVDALVLARAHARALEAGEPGGRYAVVGPYLSYRDLARRVARLTGRPKVILPLPDLCERPAAWGAGLVDRLAGGRLIDVSAASVSGAFLRLHVRGDRADDAFGLAHPDPSESIRAALAYARRVGLAPGLAFLDDGPAAGRCVDGAARL